MLEINGIFVFFSIQDSKRFSLIQIQKLDQMFKRLLLKRLSPELFQSMHIYSK